MIPAALAAIYQLPFRANRNAHSSNSAVAPAGAMLTDTTIRLVSQPITRSAMMVAGPKVVIVEDDESMRRAIERLLDVAGFQIAAYAVAEAVLADRADEAAACVVSDLKLPGMSGLDLLAELRAHWRSPPFILDYGL